MSLDQPRSLPRWFLALEWAIAALSSAIAAFWVFWPGVSSAPRAGWQASSIRLASAATPLLIFGFAGWRLLQSIDAGGQEDSVIVWLRSTGHRGALAPTLAWCAVGLGLLAFLLPEYHLADWAGYYLEAKPLLVWLGVLGLQVLALRSSSRRHELRERLRQLWWSGRPVLQLAAWMLLGMVVAGWLLLAAVRGVAPYEDSRYGPGVPILVWQIAIAVAAAFTFRRMFRAQFHPSAKRLDGAAFGIIWVASAL